MEKFKMLRSAWDTMGVSREQRIDAVKRGLPIKHLHQFLEKTQLPQEAVFKVLKLTNEDFEKKPQLSPEQSERLWRLAAVYENSRALFEGDSERTFQWLNGPLPPDGFESLELSIPESCIGKRISLDELKKFQFDWRAYPSHMLLQEIGSEWIASAVMEVPSAVSPSESNFLLNPAHADFQKIKAKHPEPLVWDPRLIELSRGL